ncbi:hypothetical protein CLOM_g8150 [Closterium sp. NIES-68]|nr:hypothetical protein CLOM_g8150 [Closterium sp. NIES-68]GJP68239.1 hypothetical protein CLOP_g24965 [Closterium sp. NIES-67]
MAHPSHCRVTRSRDPSQQPCTPSFHPCSDSSSPRSFPRRSPPHSSSRFPVLARSSLHLLLLVSLLALSSLSHSLADSPPESDHSVSSVAPRAFRVLEDATPSGSAGLPSPRATPPRPGKKSKRGRRSGGNKGKERRGKGNDKRDNGVTRSRREKRDSNSNSDGDPFNRGTNHSMQSSASMLTSIQRVISVPSAGGCNMANGQGCSAGDHHYIDPVSNGFPNGGPLMTQIQAATAPRRREVDDIIQNAYAATSTGELRYQLTLSLRSIRMVRRSMFFASPLCRRTLKFAISQSKKVDRIIRKGDVAHARKQTVHLAKSVVECQRDVGSVIAKRSSNGARKAYGYEVDTTKTQPDVAHFANSLSALDQAAFATAATAATILGGDGEAYSDSFQELENAVIRLSAVGQTLKRVSGARGMSRGIVGVDAHEGLQEVMRKPPTRATSIVDFVVDYGEELVTELPNDVTTLKFNGTLGARIHSALAFPSGVFSARLQCPQGQASGLDTTFYLSTVEGGPATDAIVMSIFGNARSRVRCLVIVDGVPGSTQEVDVGGDCSAGFHNVTIMWSKQLIIWMYDGQVMRVQSRDMLSPFPLSTTMFLYASLYDTSPYPYAWQAGYLRSASLPLSATYAAPTALAPAPSLNFGLPLDPLLGAPLEGQARGRAMGRGPMWPVAIDYCSTHVETQRGYQSIRFDGTGCGGRFHSSLRYFSGSFSALYQCPRGNASGLVSAFYLSSEEGSRFQDEIDFEWLGKNHRAVQTNFYVNGGGGRELLVPLPFDCSDAFHNYTLTWTKAAIRWYVDGALVREALSSQADAYPVKPMYVYGSMWNASWVERGAWSGAYSGVDAPYFAKYKDVKIGLA